MILILNFTDSIINSIQVAGNRNNKIFNIIRTLKNRPPLVIRYENFVVFTLSRFIFFVMYICIRLVQLSC